MDAPVVVQVVNGSVQSVSVSERGGKPLTGALDADGRTWRSTGVLRKASTYQVSAALLAADGTRSSQTSTFSTLSPKATMGLTILPGDDWNVGVGMPVVVQFAGPVKNRQAATKALTVTSTPAVEGAWRWMSSAQVQWRPKVYWPAGAKVFVRADAGAVELNPGTWGIRTVTSTFSVGSAVIDTVDMKKHLLTVRENGKVVNQIPITTGKAGFLTRAGIKVIMSREESVNMDAATTGTDPKDPNYYRLNVRWAMRLTWSGEYLHAAPWSVGYQGHANVSHGCTGMSDSYAKWLYDRSKVGDVVVYTGSSRSLEWGNGYTAWDKTFAAWSSGT